MGASSGIPFNEAIINLGLDQQGTFGSIGIGITKVKSALDLKYDKMA